MSRSQCWRARLRVSTPFLFVSLGECLTEKSGRINLGLEGTLVMGAMSGYGIAYLTGSPWCGVLVAGLAGMMLGAIHAMVCGLPRVNDIAVGIALMLFGVGLAFFLGKPFIQPQAPLLPSIGLGWWSDIPQVRAALEVNALFLIGLLLVRLDGMVPDAHSLGSHRSGRGRKRRCGARDRVSREPCSVCLHGGGRVFRRRRRIVPVPVLSGQLERGPFERSGPDGRCVVIFARWDPVRCLYAALLFGAAGSLGPALQSVGITQGYYLFNAVPYLLTLIIMIARVRRAGLLLVLPVSSV